MYMVVPLYICRYIIYITNLYNKTFHYISYSDDDDYDEDDRDEINMSAPPFKRSRFSDINPEAELKIIRSGMFLLFLIFKYQFFPSLCKSLYLDGMRIYQKQHQESEVFSKLF